MGLLRKFIALIIGLPILIVGIILVPLPGPGLVICFLGLFILSLEFSFAKRYLDKVKDAFRKIYREAKDRADKIEKDNK
jgi:tellurite resistance protein TerC